MTKQTALRAVKKSETALKSALIALREYRKKMPSPLAGSAAMQRWQSKLSTYQTRVDAAYEANRLARIEYSLAEG